MSAASSSSSSSQLFVVEGVSPFPFTPHIFCSGFIFLFVLLYFCIHMLSYLWDFHLETTSICCDACVVSG